jgi:hypothetical protein
LIAVTIPLPASILLASVTQLLEQLCCGYVLRTSLLHFEGEDISGVRTPVRDFEVANVYALASFSVVAVVRFQQVVTHWLSWSRQAAVPHMFQNFQI